MRIAVAVAAARNQFSAMLDALAVKHDVVLVAPADTLRYDGLPVVPVWLPAPSQGADPARTRRDFTGRAEAFATALASLNGTGVDVVFGQASFGATWLAREALDVPVVSHVELPAMQMKAARAEFPLWPDQERAHEALSELVFSALERSDAVITPSRHAARYLPADVADRVTVCMEGFDPRPPPADTERRSLRLALGLDPDRPVIGFFGRTLEAVRGFDVFAQVVADMRPRRPCTFVAVGAETTLYGNETSYLPDGQSFVGWALNRAGLVRADIDLRPFVDAATFERFLRSTDVAVLPLYESAGNWTFFQCLANGVPLVAADTCFVPEVVQHGVNGLLGPVSDPRRLSDLAVQLIDDRLLRGRISIAASQTVATRYSVEAAAKTYEEVFNSVTSVS